VVSLVALLAWLVGGYFVLAHPRVDTPARVDAILVLGPPNVDGRSAEGLELAEQGFAPTVVISIVSELQRRLKPSCANNIPGITVICFLPDPATTRGEGHEIQRLAVEHGWKSIMVITSRYHVARARMILDRCVDARILVVAAPGRPSISEYAYQYLYQSAGFVKALFQPNC
jgi:uncharacterized SAM-binding protein YcdF (DUF218 family)